MSYLGISQSQASFPSYCNLVYLLSYTCSYEKLALIMMNLFFLKIFASMNDPYFKQDIHMSFILILHFRILNRVNEQLMGFPDGASGNEPTCQLTRLRDTVSIPGSGRSLEKEIATHSSILAWGIPWTEEPGGLQSMRSQRVRHD